MKTALIGLAIGLLGVPCHPQVLIESEKEFLGRILTGDGDGEAKYLMTEEGFFSPGGINVGPNGELFSISNLAGKPVLQFAKGQFSPVAVPDLPEALFFPNTISAASQQGTNGGGTYYFSLGKQYLWTNFDDERMQPTQDTADYPTPFGAVWESVDHRQLFSAEFVVGKPALVRDREETRTWLPQQPGGFSIGEDGLLYRRGELWSASRPSDRSPAGTYVGKLMSGHNLWVGGGAFGFNRFVVISNSQRTTELVMTIPWAPVNNSSDQALNPFTYGIGPWGELYYLIAPEWDQRTRYAPGTGKSSELVVVRNHLKHFGRLNDGGVRLRGEPSTTAEILGTYAAKVGFRILQKGETEETIGGKKNVWYQVRMLDGKEGWLFGAFVQNLYDGPNGKAPPWPNLADW